MEICFHLRPLYLCTGDPNKKDYQRGRTATHYAAENGHIECLKLLINAGARYDIKDEDDKDCLDVVTPGGRKILERLSK
jgi:ankyrin repeat protein